MNQLKTAIESALLLSVVIFAVTSDAQAESPSFPGQRSDEALKRDGFTSLFDGATLNHWDVKPVHKGHWVAIDGVIDYDGKAKHSRAQLADLWTKAEFSDFELYVEWRLPAKPRMKLHPIVLYNGDFLMEQDNLKQRVKRKRLDAGDSGLYFRGSLKCQVNIWSQQLGSGEVNGYRTDKTISPEVRRACIPIRNADRPFGEWNAFLITLKGNRMSVVLNDQSVIDTPDLPNLPRRGPIALQHHGDSVQFRNIWIKETN